jgi:acyl transferase domain-containing protein
LQSLKLSENDSAVAVGVNLMLLGGTTAAICQLQALSPVGRCKTFDASADGYGRGEGVAAMILQPVSGDGRAIAILVGSAVNQVCNSTHLP